MTRVERGRAGQKIACLAANQRIRLPMLFCDGLSHDRESGRNKMTGQMKKETTEYGVRSRERQNAQRYLIHAGSDVDLFLCLP